MGEDDKLMKTLITLLTFAGLACAQYAPSTSGSTTAAAEINSKPAVRSGAGAASGNCTTGKDLWINTTTNAVQPCVATNTWGSADTHNVMDYGAKCDGATNDVSAIQAAHDSLPSTGGVILIPKNATCIIGTPGVSITKSSVSLISANTTSEYGAIIKSKTGDSSYYLFTVTGPAFSTSNITLIGDGTLGSPATGTVSGIFLSGASSPDGDNNIANTVFLSFLKGVVSTVKNVIIHDSNFASIVTGWEIGDSSDGDSRGYIFTNNSCHGTSRTGWCINVTGSYVSKLFARGNYLDATSGPFLKGSFSQVSIQNNNFVRAYGDTVDIIGSLIDVSNNDVSGYYATVTLTRSGTTATATTVSPHQLNNSDQVVITGATHSQYNGTYAVTVTGGNTFAYTMGSDPGASDTGAVSLIGSFVKVSGTSARIKVSGNQIAQVGNDAVNLTGTDIKDIDILSNQIVGAQGAAIRVSTGSDRIAIKGNTVSYSGYGIYADVSANLDVSHNTISNSLVKPYSISDVSKLNGELVDNTLYNSYTWKSPWGAGASSTGATISAQVAGTPQDLASFLFSSAYSASLCTTKITGVSDGGWQFWAQQERLVYNTAGTITFTTVGTDAGNSNVTLSYTDIGSNKFKVTATNAAGQTMRGAAVIECTGNGSNVSGNRGIAVVVQ